MNKDLREQIFNKVGNRVCFDCNQPNPLWVSLNNSIFLCKECQVQHRSYGISISYIKSIELDFWKEDQISILKLGGNDRLKELMSLYNVKSNTDRHTLFFSKLLDYYRRLLRAEVKNDPRPEPPSDDEALVSIEEAKNVNNYNENNENTNNDLNDNTNYNNESNSNDTINNSKISNILNSAWSKTLDVASNIKNKIDETGVSDKIKESSNFVTNKAKEGSSELTKIGTSVYNSGSNYAKTGVDYTKQKYTDIKEKGVAETAKSAANSLFFGALKGINTISTFISNSTNQYVDKNTNVNIHDGVIKENSAKEDDKKQNLDESTNNTTKNLNHDF